MSNREFNITNQYSYNHSKPVLWISSHVLRYRFISIIFIFFILIGNILHSVRDRLIGVAFTMVQQGIDNKLLTTTLTLLFTAILAEITSFISGFLISLISQRISRNVRDELYLNLLGKSQTFYNRHHIGDIVARTSNDVDKLSEMFVPGLFTTFQAYGGLLIALIFIAAINLQLLVLPILYIISLLFALRPFQLKLFTIFRQMQKQFGTLNAVLTESIRGILVVKAAGQEEQELQKFSVSAVTFRDAYVKNGLIQGSYFPTLMLGIFLVFAFLHGLYLLSQGIISLGSLIAFMMLLVENMRYMTETSLYDLSLLSGGVVGAKRILDIMQEETELDENEVGTRSDIQGDVLFEDVSFCYENIPVLKQVSFHVKPGQTIAIVGQTGSGKSTLTKLINRIYDVSEGKILIDDIDIHNWNLDSLRSQISTIEQDIFLFSQSIADNIAYGLDPQPSQATIETAAKEAQAHNFIMSFQKGYNTVIGDQGVTLSGGQRQRIAIARALLINPHILILDDATSAVDSATEDEIQQAIKRVKQKRTTFLITHRLSQIRQADLILVLQEGNLIDQGTHEELVTRCNTYCRIFGVL